MREHPSSSSSANAASLATAFNMFSTNFLLPRVLCLLMGYALGCIQTAYILGKRCKHIDIREYGSGNAGTTNALRVLGKKMGVLTLCIDILKAVAAVTLAACIFGYDQKQLLIWAGAGAVIGHNHPFYMQFRGGKGVAVMIGIFLAADPRILLIAGIPALILLAAFRYMSLASITYMGLLIVATLFFYGKTLPEVTILTSVLAVMTIVRHKGNIMRLITGTERKVGQYDNTK